MTTDTLFRLLDRDGDGSVSQTDLARAARHLGWHWREAPLHATLHLLTIGGPLNRVDFHEHLAAMASDPLGPYGEVLRCGPPPDARPPRPPAACSRERDQDGGLAPLLEELAGPSVAADYRRLLDDLAPPLRLSTGDGALLVIDPQRSFTEGAWMRSIGADGPRQVAPIRQAFASIAALLAGPGRLLPRALSRCPFPPDSYDWDPGVARVVGEAHPYLIKPGNNVLWPPTNGCAGWLDRLRQRGVRFLVVSGCTLNSCVRVSAIETQRHLDGQPRVVVDLARSAARLANYAPSDDLQFDGGSSVEAAVREMLRSGVQVAARVDWTAP